MVLIKLKNVKKYYGDRLIFNIDDFKLSKGDRIGIVGENGSGKTTLIKAILGLIEVDEGNVYINESYSYISQEENYEDTVDKNKIKKLFNSPDRYESYLSGGEKVKLKVAKALSENKALIIADEPTANLDTESIKILGTMFKEYKGSLLVVSHDRTFLDNTCNFIAELQKNSIKLYEGNYSNYLIFKEEETRRKEKEYSSYIVEKNRLEKAIVVKKQQENKIKSVPKRMGNSEARLHRKMGGQRGKKKIDNAIKNLENRINHLEVKEKPKFQKEIKITIREGMEIITKVPIEINNLNLYAKDNLLINNVNLKIKKGKKVAIIGANGSGKTTLIKEIISNSKKEIKINNKVKIGYFDQDRNTLESNKNILENVKAESSFNESFIRINLDGFGFRGDDVYKKVSVLSGGEKVKVALCKIILSDNNLLILDEPTNFLDIKARECLEKSLIEMEKTLIIVCHDKKIIENVCDYLIFIENNQISEFEGTYKDYFERKKQIDASERLLIENRISEIISLLSVEKNEDKKKELEYKYFDLNKKLRDSQ
ncbi:MAG: ABC-F type ribosomal protection protein [Clostridiales bacterium]|nr:ABC-F type ribosomal protection protein [Clostridiales bacterium]